MFDRMHNRDAVLWTSMLSAYTEGGQLKEARMFFKGMVAAEVQLDFGTSQLSPAGMM